MANYRKSFNLRNGVQVDDDNFIVNANGLVGIGTSIPTEFLDVRGNAKVVGLTTTNALYAGVATVRNLTATQGVSVSGVVTATSFSGSASGLTGIYAIAVDGWYVNGGNISTTSNVGIGTTNPQGTLQIGIGVTINSGGNATYSGIVTASSFNGVGSNVTSINASNISSGTLSNSRLPSNINVSGVITATSGFVGNITGNLTGNVTGIANTAQSLTGTPNITVGVVTASSINSGFSTVGIATIFTNLDVGTGGTAFTVLNSGRIGVGTAIPTSEIQIRKASSSLLEVISDNNQARISIGQSVGVGRSTAVLRFGNTNKTLDIINNDTGNVNTYLHAGIAGINTGRFEWIYGQTNAQLMSLTYGGRLGLGKTNPDETLHVVGTSTVTSDAWFGSDVTIKGTLSAVSLSIPSLTGTLLGNVYSTSGISTFNNVTTSGSITVSTGSSIGIGTTVPIVELDLREKSSLIGYIGIGTNKLYGQERLSVTGTFVIPNGGVGIGTTQVSAVPPFADIQIYGKSTDFHNSSINIKTGSTVGFNTYIPKSVLDFSNVGSATTRPVVVFPNIDNTTRNGIGLTPSGSVIFNTTTSKLQVWTGTAWADLH